MLRRKILMEDLPSWDFINGGKSKGLGSSVLVPSCGWWYYEATGWPSVKSTSISCSSSILCLCTLMFVKHLCNDYGLLRSVYMKLLSNHHFMLCSQLLMLYLDFSPLTHVIVLHLVLSKPFLILLIFYLGFLAVNTCRWSFERMRLTHPLRCTY